MHRPRDAKRWTLAAVLLVTAALAVTPFVDQRAVSNYESLFQRALVTFALARTLNGVISAAQGTELALQPAGVGVTLTPGEILDPVNDLVERFSWIMLAATVSLGIQSVLLDFSKWWVLQGLVAVLAVWLLILYFSRRESSRPQRKVLWRVLLVAIFLRFAVPLTLIANDLLYQVFLEPRYTESTQAIASAGEDLERLGAEQDANAGGAGDAAPPGVLDSMARAVSGATRGIDLRARVDRMQERAAAMIEHLIQLSVVFILQTGILPIVFLWLFVQLAKWLFRPIRL